MLSYLFRRLLALIPVLLGLSIVVFLIIRAIPGDPAQIILGETASAEDISELNETLGLNNPWYIQYFDYLKSILTGDLGTSLQTKSEITVEIIPYLAATLELTVFSMIFAIIVGVNLGIISAWKQNSLLDYGSTTVALIGVSIPVFWLGLMAQWIFAQELSWLPSTGRIDPRTFLEVKTHFYILDSLLSRDFNSFIDIIRHLVLPAITLGTIPMSIIARITRSSMLEVMGSDYVRTAESKGLNKFIVVYKHAFKNAFIPILTIIGLQVGLLLGGAVLTETIFGWPGIGNYIFTAIGNRDYTVIQSGILVIATLFVLINLFVDLLYAFIDPRIKYK